mgnify:CR=1 FL=1
MRTIAAAGQSRKVKINTISFHPLPAERELLRSLSVQNHGVYVERWNTGPARCVVVEKRFGESHYITIVPKSDPDCDSFTLADISVACASENSAAAAPRLKMTKANSPP